MEETRTRGKKRGGEKMGRGKRREVLIEQRRKHLALLKKCRPSTEDDNGESESSSEEDRPICKRLNRIDSDEEGKNKEDEEKKLRKTLSKDKESNSPNRQQASRGSMKPGAESAAFPRDRAGQNRSNSPPPPDQSDA